MGSISEMKNFINYVIIIIIKKNTRKAEMRKCFVAYPYAQIDVQLKNTSTRQYLYKVMEIVE
jgi:hypothetical protein